MEITGRRSKSNVRVWTALLVILKIGSILEFRSRI